MTYRHDGGPAFPRPASDTSGATIGMSLHDAAALAAIHGLCVGYWSQGGLDVDDIATTANHIADAFIAARSEAKP